MSSIQVTTDQLWAHFLEHKDDDSSSLLASNAERGIEVYLAEESGFPAFHIVIARDEICCIESKTQKDAEDTYAAILAVYVLDLSEITDSSYDPEKIDFSADEKITSAIIRNMQERYAMENLIQTMLGAHPDSFGINKKDIAQMLRTVRAYLSENLGIDAPESHV